MLLAGHSCCGKGKGGSARQILLLRADGLWQIHFVQLPLLHAQWEELRHSTRRHRRSLSSMCCWSSIALASSPSQVSLQLQPAAVAGQQFWHFSPALMWVEARCGCCCWVGGTAASLQRLKTHFQRAAGASVGISLPWHGHEASLAAACWGSCGWGGGGGDCLHACA